jgi:sRNA-binding protein
MSILNADATVLAALSGLKEKTEVRDADGNIIGYFTPREVEIARLGQLAATKFDPQELRRRAREQKGQGKPLADVLRRLEAQEPR